MAGQYQILIVCLLQLSQCWTDSSLTGFISDYISSSPALKPSQLSHCNKRASSTYPKRNRGCVLPQRQTHQHPHNATTVYSSTSTRHFHDYFVTHLPQSSLHPDSRSAAGPGHKLPRAASIPHKPGSSSPPPAATTSAHRDLTVVRIPLKKAKHHFGASVARGNRPYQEDRYQAGTIELPAFAKRAPISLSRKQPSGSESSGISADGASGDPQVFYFAVFDGHGGDECSEFLKEDLHGYIEQAAAKFELKSSLRDSNAKGGDPVDAPVPEQLGDEGDLDKKGKVTMNNVELVSEKDIKGRRELESNGRGAPEMPANTDTLDSEDPLGQPANINKAEEMETSLVQKWKETVGGYFRRFKPDHFITTSDKSIDTIPIETVLMFAFLNADLEFITAQAGKPEADSPAHLDAPMNANEVFGDPSRTPNHHKIGGEVRFFGGSTASIALISTPTPTPFWHPATPSTLIVAHVGDTRIILCETSTGLAIPVTTDHHPSSPIEGNRLRRYAATFVTDSFGEERMSGLANTRAFGDMRSKRIGVSAEPELSRVEMGPAQYSFLVLVSDGVSGTCSDQEIVDIVKEAKTPEDAARNILGYSTDVTKEGDNATALVVRLGGWERRGEGGVGSLGTKEGRDWRRNEALDPRGRRT